MRGRGIPTMRRGAGGRFWPSHVYTRGEGTRLGYPRDWRGGWCGHASPRVASAGGRGAGLVPKDLLQYRRGTCMSVDEEAVRQLAQLIWETEGRPDGQQSRHWEMATKLAESAAMAPARAPHPHTIDTLFPEPNDAPDDEPQ